MKQYTSSRLIRFLLVVALVVYPFTGSMDGTTSEKGGTEKVVQSAVSVEKKEKREEVAAKVEMKKPDTVKVIATAYSKGTECNGEWAGQNALGGRLKSGKVNSAAADWSRFPMGTKFRVKETGKIYLVDDYGSAMVGKDKVDLYTPSEKQMDRWGVRKVHLEVIEWGSHAKSLKVLKTRGKAKHIRKMVEGLEAKLAEG